MSFFINKTHSFVLYNIASCVVAILGSLFLLSLTYYINLIFNLGIVNESNNYIVGISDVFGFIVVAPTLETILLVVLINYFLKFDLNHLQVCTVSAVIWGLAHGLIDPVRFLGTVWNFFIFSYSYIHWLSISIKKAFAAAFLPHILINACAVLVLYVS